MLVLLVCTWVLWSEFTNLDVDVPARWTAVAPFADEAACQQGLQAKLAWWRKSFTQKDLLGVVGGTTVFLQKEAKNPWGRDVRVVSSMDQYQCWPDTVDPRPK